MTIVVVAKIERRKKEIAIDRVMAIIEPKGSITRGEERGGGSITI